MPFIRRTQKKDLPKVIELFVRMFKWSPMRAKAFMGYWLRIQPDLAFLAGEKKEIIGAIFVGVKPLWDGNHLFDGEIFVSPAAQRKGIGSALVNKMLNIAIKKYHVTSWEAFTFRTKGHPLGWHKKLGFVENKKWIMISGRAKKIQQKSRKYFSVAEFEI